MESVITRVVVNDGSAPDSAAVVRDRMTAAASSPGWIGGSILTPEDDAIARVIVNRGGTRAVGGGWR